MREFLDSSKKFFSDIDTLRNYTRKFNYLSSQKNNGILDSKTEKSVNNQIEVINERFKSLSNELKDQLNEFNEILDTQESEMKKFDYQTMQIHVHAQTKALANSVNQYRDAQYKQKHQEETKFKLQFVIAKPDADENEINEFISDDKNDAKLGAAFALGSKSAKSILNEAEKRKTNIRKIAMMIQDLIEMMRILDEAIHKQSAVVDKISENTETAYENTAAANVDLEQALDYQIRASRIKRIIIGILAVLVIAGLGFLILKFGFLNGGSSNDTNRILHTFLFK